MNEATLPFDPDEKLHEAIASFEQACDDGQSPNPRTWLARYPESADRLRQYFSDRDMFGPLAAPLAPTCAVPDPFPELAEYQILERIGGGGMGVVYRARQKKLNRLVAVKVIRGDRSATADEILRFRREAEKLAGLRHPNVVQVFDAGEDRGCPFFAMELIEGGSLARKLADGWLPTPKQAAELVRVLAAAIQYAHDAGIVHRDLKPGNILLEPTDRTIRRPEDQDIENRETISLSPQITDFGLAKKLDDGESLTHTGVVVGTAKYMSPEQAMGDSKNVGPAADIYSLGAILYELLTGRPPFLGTSLVDTLEQVRHHEPWPVRQLRPDIARDLEKICLKCLCKKPTDRYPSAAELADDLQGYLLNRPIRARSMTLLERLGRTVSQTRLLADFHAYSNAYVIAGVFFFAAYAAVFLLARYEGPEWLIWPAIFAPYAILFRIFRRHRYPWNGFAGLVPDRQIWSIWIGHLLAVVSLLLAFRLSGRNIYETIAAGIPVQAALTGMALFIMGCDYWGRYYLFGLVWFAAAIQMVFAPTWAPLEYAILAALGAWHIAWTMRRLSQEDRQKNVSSTR
jgi:serine/threonine protein kinase